MCVCLTEATCGQVRDGCTIPKLPEKEQADDLGIATVDPAAQAKGAREAEEQMAREIIAIRAEEAADARADREAAARRARGGGHAAEDPVLDPAKEL